MGLKRGQKSMLMRRSLLRSLRGGLRDASDQGVLMFPSKNRTTTSSVTLTSF